MSGRRESDHTFENYSCLVAQANVHSPRIIVRIVLMTDVRSTSQVEFL